MSIINFKTIRFKLTALVNTAHIILHYRVMRPFSNLRLPKKIRQKPQIQKKLSEKSGKDIKKLSSKIYLFPTNCLTARRFFFFQQHDFKKSTIMNKYNLTPKLLRKPMVSTPLNSIAFNGSQ